MLQNYKSKLGKGNVIEEKIGTQDVVSLVVGVDAGSTQTRVCIADKKDAELLLSGGFTAEACDFLRNNVYVIPSTYAVVVDEREIKPNSSSLEDNYDSRIIRVRSSAVSPLIGSDRIVRGQKILDSAGLVSRYLDSSTNKMDNSIFYVNVLDGIGYALLQKYNGKIPSRVNIHLVLSVRPKEMNTLCQRKMNDNLIGEFIFRWKSISINMVISEATYTTEPEAQITGTSAVMDYISEIESGQEAGRASLLSQKIAESESYIHIEGGGSSVGVEVVKNGHIIDACSSTFQLGGNYLVRIIIDRLREIKGRAISEESVRNAVRTCLLKNGREREDISGVVAACKEQVAYDIFERMRHEVIDVTTDLSLLDMDFISLGGRLFNEDEAGNSIGEYFSNYVRQVSPNTEVLVLEDNCIPQGNLIIGLLSGEFSEESKAIAEEEEEAAV